MGIKTAKSAGFCFGVNRAVDIVKAQIEKKELTATLGEIIHNPQMVEHLKNCGIRVLNAPEEAKKGETVVIRSHGVGEYIYDYFNKNSIKYIDATCPFVSNIQKIVANAKEDDTVLIAGDNSHPEVIGILGHCKVKAFTFKNEAELVSILRKTENQISNSYILVAQTTFNTQEWIKCVNTAKKVCTNLNIFDTICSATAKRQCEAEEIAKSSDTVIVIGGRHSSNTAKLAEICSVYCRTILIETAAELYNYSFDTDIDIGVTAGASTPACIIKEVQETMSEIVKKEDEMTFEELLAQEENSFKSTYTGERVTGVVTSIVANEVAVDIGTKHAGYIPMNELTADPTAKVEDIVKKGDELELIVIRVNDMEGTVMLSKKRLDAVKSFDKIIEAEKSKETLEGIVTDAVKGGVLALTGGVKIFIPASQATMSRSEDPADLLKKKVEFKIVEVNLQRKRAVGSIRAVRAEQRKVLEDKFWESVEIGRKYSGVVKSITSYGAFVDLGGVDGMIHISELSWNRIKHPSEVVNVGDTVEVYVKDIDAEKRKISLGYKKTEDNPWEILKANYEVGNVVKVKIVSMTAFGAFAQILPGVDGLIHISQISNERINKPQDVLEIGQEVDAKITEMDFEKKRISLSIRALLDEQPADDSEDAE